MALLQHKLFRIVTHAPRNRETMRFSEVGLQCEPNTKAPVRCARSVLERAALTVTNRPYRAFRPPKNPRIGADNCRSGTVVPRTRKNSKSGRAYTLWGFEPPLRHLFFRWQCFLIPRAPAVGSRSNRLLQRDRSRYPAASHALGHRGRPKRAVAPRPGSCAPPDGAHSDRRHRIHPRVPWLGRVAAT